MYKGRPIDEDVEILKEKNGDLTARIGFDPMGSYTGRPIAIWEQPVQDADDL